MAKSAHGTILAGNGGRRPTATHLVAIPDEEIPAVLDRLREGDPAALQRLFEHVAQRFHPLAHRLLRHDFGRVGIYAETNDILHDTLCRLMPYLKRLEADACSSGEQFHALVATVLRRTLIDTARKFFGSLQGHPIGEGMEGAHPLLQQSSGLERWRERLRVHEMFERLPGPERRVLEMKYYLGLSLAEMADLLNVCAGTVSRRLSTAKELLGHLLRNDDGKSG